MRHLDYYATLEESLAILDELCTQNYKVIAQPGFFDKPDAPVFERVDEQLREIVKISAGPNAGKYFINSGTQGPLIEMRLARVNPVDGVQRALAGQIGHKSAYRNPETNQMEPPSEELKTAFKKAVSIIKKRGVTYQSERGKILVAPAALELLTSGQAKLQDA
jgi:hypothetical protein